MITPANTQNLPEVLKEQILVLMIHYAEHQHSVNCPECLRFKSIESLLLIPFRTTEYPVAIKAHKKKVFRAR